MSQIVDRTLGRDVPQNISSPAMLYPKLCAKVRNTESPFGAWGTSLRACDEPGRTMARGCDDHAVSARLEIERRSEGMSVPMDEEE